MASFRNGFKIFGKISLKQGLGRIRSFSEDRKPGKWLPEDQWAVRQPGSTCPEPCDKPQKPPKPSKSWLSVCKDPEPVIECDIRHNNCPPPPTVKTEGPWYSLDNLIPKKKPQEKPPPIQTCREEMKRRELYEEEEEVCENVVDKNFIVDIKPEPPECCMPKQDPCPAPVVTLSCPLPKELDIMLWCGKPSTDTTRIAAKCQSDKLPYQEFRPQKSSKPPPFSLPIRADPPSFQSPCCNAGFVAYSEFKQVEVPRPLYTRYKSVELQDHNFLLCMTDVKCSDDEPSHPLAITPPLPPNLDLSHREQTCKKKDISTEKPIIEAGCCKPVRIKKAPKYKFREKPTKLIERRVFRNPCAQHKNCDLTFRTEESGENERNSSKLHQDCEPPKVLTGTLTDEPQIFEREFHLSSDPPRWMYVLCKPGIKETPLIPNCEEFPKEPDWSSETDGLKFYDGDDEFIHPKPPPDPCLTSTTEKKEREASALLSESPTAETPPAEEEPSSKFRSRYVLMPEKYRIKNMRPDDDKAAKDDTESFSIEKFIEAKTSSSNKGLKGYPQMKESILYDLQRLCPNLPLDPSKIVAPCRKPPEPDCPQPPRFYRNFSTFRSLPINLNPIQLCKIQRRTECGDSSSKCKVRKLAPKERVCTDKKLPDCAEIRLPCCPKARIPPTCNVRRPFPLCKKKAAPKPSFSECAKDPPPCPKITECNCWDKKPGMNGKNNRK